MPNQDAFMIDISELLDDDDLAGIVGLSEEYKQDMLETLKFTFKVGLNSELYRYRLVRQKEKEEKERSKEKEEKEKTIYNFNNIIYKKIDKEIFNNKTSEKLSPLQKKEIAKAERSSRKKPKFPIPKKWIEESDSDKLTDARLIEYAEQYGHDWYSAKEMFKDFVDYNLKKDGRFVDWYRAWYTWVRKDVKFNGRPEQANKSNSVIRSYTKLSGKDLINA